MINPGNVLDGRDNNNSIGNLSSFLLSPAVLSFVGGFVSASLVWYRQQQQQQLKYAQEEETRQRQEDDESMKQQRPLQRHPSFIQWMSSMSPMDDIANRIGELPFRRKRSHWPWENRKSPRNSHHERTDSLSSAGSTDHNNNINAASSEMEQHEELNSYHPEKHDNNLSPRENKSGLCIGNIFGMDVGGTLAKLAYFERKSSETSDSEWARHRAQLYRKRASAQAVVLARRGISCSVDDSSSPRNNKSRTVSTGSIPRPTLRTRSMSANRGTTSNCWDLFVNPDESEDDFSNKKQLPENGIPSGNSLPPILHHSHSSASDEDIQRLFELRQESVPDDLGAYGHIFDSVTTASSKQHFYKEVSKTLDKIHNKLPEETTVEKSEALSTSSSSSESSIDRTEIRRSRSMFDLSKSRDHAEALDRFYNFARRLDSYREGVKDHKLSFYSHELGGEFHFIRFETRRMQNAMDLIRANQLHVNIKEMGGTGGGAHKFAEQWEDELGIKMKKQDELDSLVAGMQFVLTTVVGECYTFRPRNPYHQKPKKKPEDIKNNAKATIMTDEKKSDEDKEKIMDDSSNSPDDNEHTNSNTKEPNSDEESASDKENQSDRGKGDEWWWSRKVQRDAISYSSTYPYLLVTIGTGVSVLRVDGPRQYERVSGSTIGGGTYLGLIRLLTDVDDYDDVMRLAERGDPSKCDMLVGDIYGDNSEALEKLGLPSDLVASSFGKLVAKEDPAEGLKQEDLARALLLMITINIGQVAYLNAKLFNTHRIYFVGNFLRQNKISQRRLSYAIHYWSKGEMEALFLEHEGYFGALGAFLMTQEDFHKNKPNSSSDHHSVSDDSHQKDHNHRRRKTMTSLNV